MLKTHTCGRFWEKKYFGLSTIASIRSTGGMTKMPELGESQGLSPAMTWIENVKCKLSDFSVGLCPSLMSQFF